MRRNPDLVRELMFFLEESTDMVDSDLTIKGYGRDEIAYHLMLICDSGLAVGNFIYGLQNSTVVPDSVSVQRLTPNGHDFIDNLRDETVWKTVKNRAAKAGGSISIALLSQLGSAVLKQKLGLES